MKTKYHIITLAIIALFWIVTLILPEQIRNIIYALIAGWQVGTWAQEYANHLFTKQQTQDLLKRF